MKQGHVEYGGPALQSELVPPYDYDSIMIPQNLTNC